MPTLNFNANDVEPTKDFDPIPNGKYLAAITDSELKTTKDGNGEYLELTFQVLDGEYKHRKLWARLNLKNENDQAVQIAQAELSSICRACGVMTPQDSEQLHDRPLIIAVKVTKRSDNGELTNEIKAYEPQVAATATPQKAATNTSPWLHQQSTG